MPTIHRLYFAIAILIVGMPPAQAQGASPPLVTKNIQYISRPDSPARLNQLDVYTPGTPGPNPVMVFIHGGSWCFGDKRMVGKKAEAFTDAGYVFVSINYRLSPAVQHPAHAEDCGLAVAWVHKHIAEYGGDPDRVYLMGHSAGAQLVALISTDETYLKAGGCSLSAIRGTIPLDGAGFDIEKTATSGEFLALSRYQRAFGKNRETWKNASAIMHVAAGKSIPPFLLVHAGGRANSRDRANELADALGKVGVKAKIFGEASKNHLTINSDIGKDNDTTTQAIMRFLDENGAKGQTKP
jgi:acetyl esterase/lipase